MGTTGRTCQHSRIELLCRPICLGGMSERKRPKIKQIGRYQAVGCRDSRVANHDWEPVDVGTGAATSRDHRPNWSDWKCAPRMWPSIQGKRI